MAQHSNGSDNGFEKLERPNPDELVGSTDFDKEHKLGSAIKQSDTKSNVMAFPRNL